MRIGSTKRITLFMAAAAVVVIGFSLALIAAAAWQQSTTTDEGSHLAYSSRMLTQRMTERQGDRFALTMSPACILNVLASRLAPREAQSLFFGRLASALWFVVMLAAIFFYLAPHYGRACALLGCCLAALDPNLLAHASLVTTDLPYAAASTLALLAVVRFLEERSALSAMLAGGAVGLALAVKVSGSILLFSLVLALPLVSGVPSIRPRRILKLLLEVLCAGLAACLVICAAYLFIGVGWTPHRAVFYSVPLTWLMRVLPEIPIPLPYDFVTPYDRLIQFKEVFKLPFGAAASGLSVMKDNPSWGGNVVFNQLRPNGVWYYFPALWLIKTPVLLLLASAAGIIRALVRLRLYRDLRFRLVALVFAVHLLYFVLIFENQIGYRYALMCLPMVYIMAAAGCFDLLAGRKALAAISLVLLCSIGENWWYWGNPLSFSNVLIQPKAEAYRLLSDSNIDWGQNWGKIKGWLRADGIPDAPVDPPHIVPGPNVFSLTALAGIYDFYRYKWVRDHLHPQKHYGHTYIYYFVTDDMFRRLLRAEHMLEAEPEASPECANQGAANLLHAGGSFPIALNRSEALVLCVLAEDDAVVRFHLAEAGDRAALHLCRSTERESCSRCGDLTGQGEIWYLAAPGSHHFCVSAESRSVRAETDVYSGRVRIWSARPVTP